MRPLSLRLYFGMDSKMLHLTAILLPKGQASFVDSSHLGGIAKCKIWMPCLSGLIETAM